MKDKIKMHDIATQRLVSQAEKFNLPNFGNKSFPKFVKEIRDSFKKAETHIKFFRAYFVDSSFSEGFCMYATYCLYDAFGKKEYWDIKRDSEHWWLVYKQTNEVFDITYDQFSSPYDYKYGSLEQRIGKDKEFTKILQNKVQLFLTNAHDGNTYSDF